MKERSYKIDLLKEYGLDLDNWTYKMHGSIDELQFVMLDRAVEILKKEDGVDTIYIELSTYGGDLYYGYAIHDYIEGLKAEGYQVIINCIGPVMSAGTLIISSADYVTATKNTWFMLHFGSQEGGDTDFVNAEVSQKHWKSLVEGMVDILDSRVSVTKRTLKTWLKTDKYLSAEEALKIDLIDDVV